MKKLLCLLLSALLLLSASALLFSCKKEEKKTTNTLSATDKQLEEGTIFYERAQVSDNLPEKNFGGKTFRVAALYPAEIMIEEEERGQGDLMKDATFTRNQMVEARFNTTIELVYTGNYVEVAEYASKTILAGSDEFDLLIGQSLETAKDVTKDLYLNWYDIPYIDFDQPWWFESTRNDLTYNGTCILAISHLNQTAVNGVYCMFFNKAFATSYELGDLYQLVLDGKWTYDKLHELVKDIYEDRNGNDQRDENDFYGYTQTSGTGLNAFLWAFDNPICKTNADGEPELALATDKIDSIIKDIYEMTHDTNGVWCDTYAGGGQSTATKLFYERRAIFTELSLSEATTEKLRNFEDDYGILPLPKYNEAQASYKTTVGGFHTVLAVPKTVKDIEFVGIIVEALSAESWKLKTPTLYEIALKSRYLRDDESKVVMDIIIENVTFDFGYIYNIGFSYLVEEMMRADNNNFQSYYNMRKYNAKQNIKKVLKSFDKF